ncbi:MAG: O-antigen ligase family protein [Gammaproteobacteria bacterium]
MPADLPFRWLTTFLMLVFPAATLFINRGDSYTLGLLSLIGLWVWLRDGARPWLDRHSCVLWLAFVLFFAVAVLSYVFSLQTEGGFHFLGRDLRFLFIVSTYLAFRRYPPTTKTAFIGLALGGLLSGVLAMLQFMHAHGTIRVTATTDLSIIFGDLATTMVLCTVAGFGLMAASRRAWAVPLLVLCVAGGIAATLLSGTRGAWIPLLLLPLVLMTPLGRFLKHRYVFTIVLVLVAVFSSFYFVARSGTQERITDAGRNLNGYFIALDTARSKVNGSSQLHCDSNAAFLRVWLREGYRPPGGELDADVVTDRGVHDRGCADDYAVLLRNPGDRTVARHEFRRIPDPMTGPQNTRLLVRGKGTVYFTGAKQTGIHVDSDTYQDITLVSGTAPGNAIIVYIPPHGNFWLVPLDSYFGEYSMTLAHNSVGERLELWRAAYRLFLAHPLLGVGTGAFQGSTLQLIHARLIMPFVGIYDHPHNDYLDALASRGILGFLALLAILLFPAVHFLRVMRSPNRATHAIGIAGILTVSGFAIYALTDTIFLHSMMITWYVIYMALFYALITTQSEKDETKSH